jgi:predicted O-methyltransferase YrrM
MNFKKLGWFVEGSIFSLIDNYLIFIKRKIYVYLDIYFNKKWNSSPLLKAPLKNKDYYNKLHHEEKNNQYSTIDKYENKSGYCIDKEWFEDLAFKTQGVIKKSPICYQHGRILYSTLSEYIHSNNFENINILETGTAAGFSSLCMAKALDDYLVNGRIHTFDILPHNKKMFWNRVSDHSGQSSRRELLQSWQKLTDKYIYYY